MKLSQSAPVTDTALMFPLVIDQEPGDFFHEEKGVVLCTYEVVARKLGDEDVTSWINVGESAGQVQVIRLLCTLVENLEFICTLGGAISQPLHHNQRC